MQQLAAAYGETKAVARSLLPRRQISHTSASVHRAKKLPTEGEKEKLARGLSCALVAEDDERKEGRGAETIGKTTRRHERQADNNK